MELIQFSTLTCPPCRMAREYITRNYDIDFINYTYVPMEYLSTFDERYEDIAREINVRGVPQFVVVEDGEIIYSFRGFDKGKIDKYAEYMNKATPNKIKDVLPEEFENRLNDNYNKVLDSLEDKLDTPDLENLGFKPSTNGTIDHTGLDDFLNLDNFDDLDDLLDD